MNTTLKEPSKLRLAKRLIIALSIAIPVIVAALFRVKVEGVDLSFLPAIYASINGVTAILLVFALVAIKQKKQNLHSGIIKICLALSLVFLGCYVAYHMTSEATEYLGEYGSLYYPILISHIILSILVVPLVLFTYLFAWQGNYERHKKWTRFAWPIWFYVAVSGVIVYIMISPYY